MVRIETGVSLQFATASAIKTLPRCTSNSSRHASSPPERGGGAGHLCGKHLRPLPLAAQPGGLLHKEPHVLFCRGLLATNIQPFSKCLSAGTHWRDHTQLLKQYAVHFGQRTAPQQALPNQVLAQVVGKLRLSAPASAAVPTPAPTCDVHVRQRFPGSQNRQFQLLCAPLRFGQHCRAGVLPIGGCRRG